VSTNIKSDASATDFVRLIWAYILSLYKVSFVHNCNHPSIIIFDEPAQHSMAIQSFNILLQEFSNNSELQSIVAASFDESDDVFLVATKDTSFHLINIEKKLISS
jgi:hypothetical protein